MQIVVEISGHFVHRGDEVLQDSNSFNPKRWQGSNGRFLDKWLVNLSKGPRSCLGFRYVPPICRPLLFVFPDDFLSIGYSLESGADKVDWSRLGGVVPNVRICIPEN